MRKSRDSTFPHMISRLGSLQTKLRKAGNIRIKFYTAIKSMWDKRKDLSQQGSGSFCLK